MTSHHIGALMRAKIAEVETALKVTRNDTLSRAAYRLNFFVCDGTLNASTLDYALSAAAQKAGLSEPEIRTTLASARKGAERDWKPDRHSPGPTDNFLESRRQRKGRDSKAGSSLLVSDEEVDLLAGMRNGTWLDGQDFPPLGWTVPDIISEGFGLLVAPPKAGKSWLAAGIGLASAAGGIALGWLRVEQRPVLYLALEDGHRRLQDRFRKIMANQPIPAGMHVIIRAQAHDVIPMITEFLAL